MVKEQPLLSGVFFRLEILCPTKLKANEVFICRPLRIIAFRKSSCLKSNVNLRLVETGKAAYNFPYCCQIFETCFPKRTETEQD